MSEHLTSKMSNETTGPNVTAWVCEYESGEVFVSLAQEPMNDPDVRKAWRLLTMRERDAQVTAAVAAERERCAKLCEDIADEYQRQEGYWLPELKSDAQTGASACERAIRG